MPTKTLQRWVPENSQEIKSDLLKCTVYLREHKRPDGATSYIALAYSGKREKADFHTHFKTPERREEFVNEYFKNLAARIESKQKYKNERKENAQKFLAQLSPGVILYSSWGYEQTNIDWYQVIEVRGQLVTIREIAAKVRETLSMQGESLPVKDSFVGEPQKHLVSGPYITLTSYSSASIWDGRERHCSWYA